MSRKRQAAEAGAAAVDSIMYIGPSIPRVIAHGAVYIGSLPQAFEDLAAGHPYIRLLAVRPEGAASALRDMADPGTRLYAVYQKTIKEVVHNGNL
jgi:hypothetical protein